MNSPLPPVNLLALVLVLMIHYYFLPERKMSEKPEGMSEKTPRVSAGSAATNAQVAPTTADLLPEPVGVDVSAETTFFGERFP